MGGRSSTLHIVDGKGVAVTSTGGSCVIVTEHRSLPNRSAVSTLVLAEGSASTVANATGKKLRMFYHKEKLRLEDLLDSTKKVFKPKSEIPFIDLPPSLHLESPILEEGFASIFVAEDGEVYVETVALNFEVPHGACCIVTASKEVKFRKPDGGVWIDEDGHDHSPK